uniref:NADH dehydrogenase subunit 2 n=1 Tax=Dracunculus medinensis TaxID=318479 RepID=A0A347YC99_DRAME|nr:NADH dehydrogenase subunit 2 [Dracunculus medinensis]
MYFFGVFFFFFLSFINFLTFSVIIWWSIFALMVIYFVFLCKFDGSYVGLVNYFVIQEGLSLCFLFFYGLVQYIFLMLKCGISPLHFWLFSVCLDLKGVLFVWFLIFQKMPFVPVLLYLGSYVFLLFFLLFGIFFCHFQYYFLSSLNSILLVSSTESFNWVVLFVICSYYGFFLLIFFYLFFFWFLVSDFLVGYGWELVFVFMNFPLGLVFMVKYFVLSFFSGFFLVFFFILFFTVVYSYLCFFFWMVFLSCVDFDFCWFGFFVWFVYVFFCFLLV